MTEQKGKVDPRNKLNELTGREWIKFTKSWFIEDGKPSEITKEIDLHPASFPPPMIERFIKFFTKSNGWVLDPFLGTGSTLVACDKTNRNGVGVELYKKYYDTARSRTNQTIFSGDIREILTKFERKKYKFDLCITSPPYFTILKKEKDYNQQARLKKGLDLRYGDKDKDLGNITTYQDFLKSLSNIFIEIKSFLDDNGHLIIIVQNFRHQGETIPLAFDLTQKLCSPFKYLGEMIWCQNQKVLRPYGYPYGFVSNVHHHYCLIFKNRS